MLNQKAQPRNDDRPYIGRERQVPLFESDAGGHWPIVGPIDSGGVAGVFGIDSKLTTEPDNWMCHIDAAEIFNQKAAIANIRDYFTTAEGSVVGYKYPVGIGGQVDYVVPGDEPTDPGACTAYRVMFNKVSKASAAATQTVARAYFLSYILTATERVASHHVKQR